MTIPMNDSRKDFERAMKAIDSCIGFDRSANGFYSNIQVQFCFVGWQLRESLLPVTAIKAGAEAIESMNLSGDDDMFNHVDSLRALIEDKP